MHLNFPKFVSSLHDNILGVVNMQAAVGSAHKCDSQLIEVGKSKSCNTDENGAIKVFGVSMRQVSMV